MTWSTTATSHCTASAKFKSIVGQLHGQLRILPGSHDRRWLDQFQADDPDLHTAHGYAITLLPPLTSLEIPDMREDHYPQVIVLCHYALRVWDRYKFVHQQRRSATAGGLTSVQNSASVTAIS
ncbi:MAG: hypothetical protein IPK16_30850 [Anaerolineales bacterium]|nr:hypothetical protein [Anaerolineales bacterium]